ncbi:MAG: universal stress protein [Dehalococcoidia bacterium]|nr:universal stress protein [Dehalococcoidia bacterium]
MYERILVPLDGSELAEVALPYAEEAAGRLGSEIKLLNVSELSEDPYVNMRRAYLQKIVESTRRGIKKHRGKVEAKEVKVGSALVTGDPAWEIAEYANREDIDLIVMATRGLSGFKRWALGSVADRVVRTTDRPVALIRAKGAQADVRETSIHGEMIVCLDGSKGSEAIIPYVEEMASKVGNHVTLLEVLEIGYNVLLADGGFAYIPYPQEQMQSQKASAEDYLGKIGDGLKKKGISVAWELRSGDAAMEILKLAEEIPADMVAMSTRGRSGISRWAIGSVADKVLHDGNTPLLLVRPPKPR